MRALTRRAGSPAVSALRDAGAEIVEGDLSDVAGLARWMDGCGVVFGLTNYREHFGTEVVHGKNFVDAAREAGVGHLVLSTLASMAALGGEADAVPHVETKAAIEAYAWRSGVRTTYVHVAFYFENFFSWFPPRADEHGVLRFGFPQGETPLAAVAVEDVGPIIEAIVRDPDRFAGKVVGVVGDDQRCDVYAEAMSRVLGREVRFDSVPRDVFAALPFPGAADVAAMFDAQRRLVPTRRADLELTRSLFPGAQSFERWASHQRGRLAAAAGIADPGIA